MSREFIKEKGYVIAYWKGKGFEIVDMENMTIKEVMRYIKEAIRKGYIPKSGIQVFRKIGMTPQIYKIKGG